ncbi:MAG: TolB family protein [Gaiellaceae bacterium]
MRRDGRPDARRLTNERVGVASHHPWWSADGRSIVFTSNRGALMQGGALHVVRLDGGRIRRLARPAVEDGDPDWQLP